LARAADELTVIMFHIQAAILALMMVHTNYNAVFSLARDAFVRRNRRAIAMMFVCLSACDSRAL